MPRYTILSACVVDCSPCFVVSILLLLFYFRFNIGKIAEFYGATEGNAQCINTTNRVGSVGFTSVIAPHMHPLSIILVDKITGTPIRGWCEFS